MTFRDAADVDALCDWYEDNNLLGFGLKMGSGLANTIPGGAMRIVNIHDAKTNFSKLIDAVGKGEEVVIARAGRPVAQLVPIEPPQRTRKPGALKGKLNVAEDFDAPLPDPLLATFEGPSH